MPDVSSLAEQGASMPALGLSNKLMDDTGDVPFIGNSEEDRNIFVAPTVLTCLFQLVPNSSVFFGGPTLFVPCSLVTF